MGPLIVYNSASYPSSAAALQSKFSYMYESSLSACNVNIPDLTDVSAMVSSSGSNVSKWQWKFSKVCIPAARKPKLFTLSYHFEKSSMSKLEVHAA